MKTVTLCAVMISASLFAQQVPNGGFESWTNMGSYDDPTNWITSNNNSANVVDVVQSNNAHGGSYAVRINTLNVQNFIIGGVLAAPSVGNFFPISNPNVNAVTGWYISNFVGGDKLKVIAAMRQGSTTVGGNTDYITNNTTVYQQFTFPMTFSQQGVADSSALAFDEVTATGGTTGLNANTYVILDDVDYIITTGIEDQERTTAIRSIYPNPSSGTTWIEYSVADNTMVTLELCDISGRLIQTLVSQQQIPGNYRVAVDAFTLAHGLYMVRLNTGNTCTSMKLSVSN